MFRYQLYCYNISSNHDVNMQRLSITKQGQVRYELKTPYRDGTDYRLVRMYSSHPSISLAN